MSISPQCTSLPSSPRRPPVRYPSLPASSSFHSVAMTRRTSAAWLICWPLQPKVRHLPMRARRSAIHRDGGASGIAALGLEVERKRPVEAEKGRRGGMWEEAPGATRRHAAAARRMVGRAGARGDNVGIFRAMVFEIGYVNWTNSPELSHGEDWRVLGFYRCIARSLDGVVNTCARLSSSLPMSGDAVAIGSASRQARGAMNDVGYRPPLSGRCQPGVVNRGRSSSFFTLPSQMAH